MDTQNNMKNGQTKERKLSLSFIRKSLRKSSSNQLNETSGGGGATTTRININDENTSFVANGPTSNTDCQCGHQPQQQQQQQQQQHQHEKGRKNIFKNLKKKMHLKESFMICRSKQKMKNTISPDTTSDESTSNNCLCTTTSNNCDKITSSSMSSRVPDVSSSIYVPNNENCDGGVGPEVPPRERRNRPPDLVIQTTAAAAATMEGSVTPDDSPLEFSNNSLTLAEPSAGRGLIRELKKLAHEGWYWGPVTRQEAEEKLHGQPDGAFLVRDSSSDNYLLSVSFRSSGRTLHTRIEYSYGMFSFYAQEGFPSIAALINHSMSYSQAAVYCYSTPRSPTQPSFPVRLTKPLSRFMQVRSLQYLCRFVIRQYTRLDNIQKLPLPKPIKGYIEEGHY